MERARMRLYQLTAASLALIACVVGSRGADSSDEKPKRIEVMPLGSDIILPEDQHRALEGAAIDGSIEASDRVVQHYTQQSDREALVYWARIAAENGSTSGQQLIAILLEASSDPRDQRRAAFWRAKGKHGSQRP